MHFLALQIWAWKRTSRYWVDSVKRVSCYWSCVEFSLAETLTYARRIEKDLTCLQTSGGRCIRWTVNVRKWQITEIPQ
jgi:hypothetical protein